MNNFSVTKFGLIALLALGFAACKKDTVAPPVIVKDALTVEVYPYFGNDLLLLDSVYQTNEGYDVQFTDLKFYACNWKNGTEVLTEVALFDFRESGNHFISVEKKPDAFTSIQGLLGVEPALNHADPTAFPNDHVLNITNAGGMHWGWNPGYIFIQVEAKVDTIQDGVPLFDHNVVIHVGTDNYLQTLDFPTVQWTAVGTQSFLSKMKLDMKQFLTNGTQTINLKNEYLTHSGAGQEALSLKAIQNFKAALSFMN